MDVLRRAQYVPVFSRESSRYDMKSFTGRMLHFYSVNDPRTLLFTEEQARSAERLLKLHDTGEAPEDATDFDFWHARRVLESALHPDTGDPIPRLFRFSAFVPVNMLIVTATITPMVISSFLATAFIHFLNQTYNAALNYANRNASNPVPAERLAEGYAGAVITSLSIGMVSTTLTKRAVSQAGGGGASVAIIRCTLPFLATALAGASNVLLMRRNELSTGVDVFDDNGRTLGKSIKAGRMGLMKCAAARIIWNVPVMIFPPIIMSRLEHLLMVSSSPHLRMLCETAVVTTCLLAAVSPALAFFPQRDSVAVDSLETKFHDLVDKVGRPIARVWYNKGL